MDQGTATLERVRDGKASTGSNPIIETKRKRHAADLQFSKTHARRHLELLNEDGDGAAKFTFFTADDRKDCVIRRLRTGIPIEAGQ